ncbi:hypothetical protein M3Y95_00897100 [Aphelenchoides besseyi]|nr:hypothetical protein M3Y95_00897100 [Aphelenchoides besseyi]
MSIDSVDGDCMEFVLTTITSNCFQIVAVWLVVVSWSTFVCKKQNKATNVSKPVGPLKTPVALPAQENQKPEVKKVEDEKPKEKPAEKPQAKAQTEGMTVR